MGTTTHLAAPVGRPQRPWSRPGGAVCTRRPRVL